MTATIDDYLNEFEASLTDYWVTKLALDVTARAVVTYVKRLEANLHPMKKSKAFLMGRSVDTQARVRVGLGWTA